MEVKQVNGRAIVAWDCSEDAEGLYHEDRDSAMECYLDGRDQWEGTITLHGYASMVVPEPTEMDADRLLEDFFESHWEEYLDEDGPNINDAMSAAALAFLKVLHRELKPFACEVVHSEEVDVAAWLEQRKREEATG